MKQENDKQNLKLIALFTTVPFVIAVPIIIGWFLGNWLDKIWDTTPYITYSLLFLGFIAGFRELYRLLKKYLSF